MTIPLTTPGSLPQRLGRTVAFLLTAAALALASFNPVQSAASEQRGAKPAIVLVNGSWADASSWNGVTERLQDGGYTVRAIPNPPRSVASPDWSAGRRTTASASARRTSYPCRRNRRAAATVSRRSGS
ncbi:hypothetical protein GCM10009789_06020 [Kribbella sancticallisti]|uniref:Alpha/beta hydrolase family protein n=1 Tax=Kribbella sancticallisti TaxID=460087 RepID=A0ABN2CAM6_9ACTN